MHFSFLSDSLAFGPEVFFAGLHPSSVVEQRLGHLKTCNVLENVLCGVCLLTGCSSSGRAASCLIFPFSTMGLNSTTLNFISFSLEFSIHFL